MAALGLLGSPGGGDDDEKQHSQLLENLTREQTKLGNMKPGQRFSLGDANKNISIKAFLPTADDDDDDDDFFESEFPVEDLDKEAPAGMDKPPKTPIAGAQEQADEAMEDAAPEGATTPSAEQDAAMRTEGLEQTAKGGQETSQANTGMQDASDAAGGPETPQADPAMQDASDAAGKASSQQGPSQDHPDVPKRTPASDGTGESAAEDQPMIEPGSHADMLAGAETEQEAHTEPTDTAMVEAAPPIKDPADKEMQLITHSSPEQASKRATPADASPALLQGTGDIQIAQTGALMSEQLQQLPASMVDHSSLQATPNMQQQPAVSSGDLLSAMTTAQVQQAAAPAGTQPPRPNTNQMQQAGTSAAQIQQAAAFPGTVAAKSPGLQACDAMGAGAKSQPGASKARSTTAVSLAGSSPAGILITTASPLALSGFSTQQQGTNGSVPPRSTAPAAATTGGPVVNPVRAAAAAGGKAGPVHVALTGQPGQQLGSGQLNQQLGSAAITPPLQPRRSISPAAPSTMKGPSWLLPMPKPALGRLPQMIRVNASGRPQQAAGIPAKTPAPPANPPAAASPNPFTPAQNSGINNPDHSIPPGGPISSGRASATVPAVQSHHPPPDALARQGNLHAAVPESGLPTGDPHNQHLQAPGSADNVQGTSSSGSLGGGNPTAPPFGDVVRIPDIIGTAGDVGTAGRLPDQPEPEEASQVPAEKSASRPTFHLEMVRQQRKLEQMMLEAQRMTDQALELKVMAAIVGNRLTRLNNPMMAAKLQEMKRHAEELLKDAPDSFKSRRQTE